MMSCETQETSPVATSDAARVRARRQQAFTELVLPEVEALRRAAVSICRQQADAEDLLQETLLRAYRSIDTFDGSHPRAWLLTILRNTSLNLHRRWRPRLLDDPELVQYVLATERPASPGPEEIIFGSDGSGVVGTAFDALPAPQRRVLTLLDVDGLTCAEAAHVLGIPIGTVMSRAHRARDTLRRRLAMSGEVKGY